MGSIPDIIEFFNLPDPSSSTMNLRSIQPLTGMNTRNLPAFKCLPDHKDNQFTAICEPII
jgi:hypothetical protein